MLLHNTRQKEARRRVEAKRPADMTRSERQNEIAHQLHEARAVTADPGFPVEARRSLEAAARELAAKQSTERLEIVACGAVSSGKSSLLNALAGGEMFKTDVKAGSTLRRNEAPWPGQEKVTLVDAPGLEEAGGEEREAIARLIARDADLVLFVVDGPLRNFEFDMLARLAKLDKPIVVCVNKEDWFRADDRETLRRQICDQVTPLVPKDNVLSVRARATKRVRVRVAADGSEIDETIAEEPDLTALADRLLEIVSREGQDLLLANLLLRARGLAISARSHAQGEIDRRANKIVDRTMWQAGAAAALSPLPMIDLAASLALTTKMVVELAGIYRQPLALDTATQLLGQMSKHLVSVTGTSIAGPALGAAIATTLKTVPGVGTLTGGILQGLTQALVTRWIGRIFMRYFRDAMREPAEGWGAVAREEWKSLTRPGELADFVRSGLKRLVFAQDAGGQKASPGDGASPGKELP